MITTGTRGFASRIATFEKAHWVVPAIVALALMLRIALLLLFPQDAVSDSEWYMVRAAEMARGMGYQEAGHPTAFWPVGYPALLAGSMILFGPGLLGPLLINLVSVTVILGAILLLGRELAAGALASRIAILLYALYPAHIVYTGQTSSETASTALGLVAFVVLIAGRKNAAAVLLAGALFGLLTLMRAQMMLYPVGVIIALPLVFRDFRLRDALRAGVLVHLTLAAIVLPWSLRNVEKMGSFVPVSTNGGVALFYGANERATGDWFAWERTPYWDNVVGIPYAERVEQQVEIDRRFKAKSKEWIVAHPGQWAILGVKKMALLWVKDSDAFWALGVTYPDRTAALRTLQAFDQLCYLVLTGLGLATLALAGRRRLRGNWDWAPLLLLGCMPAFVTLTAFGFTGQTRYHYTAMPYLILAAGWLLARGLNRGASGKSIEVKAWQFVNRATEAAR